MRLSSQLLLLLLSSALNYAIHAFNLRGGRLHPAKRLHRIPTLIPMPKPIRMMHGEEAGEDGPAAAAAAAANESQRTSNINGDMSRELHVFFERAALAGSDAVAKLTPMERMKRVIAAESIEDEIFEIQDKLYWLNASAMRGNQESMEEVKRLRLRVDELKVNYIEVVGGVNDLPIYFGKYPDSFQ
jgi:hypothetical protein